ncbi:MAG: hypothetical protein HZB15_12515 [Actinobacteria bacterium]|nr:hypothetical protein [Actinomycetota bacterium]
MDTSEFVFRHAGGCLIESPDLPALSWASAQRWRWVATVWIDQQAPDGWGALEWTPGERGWELPATTAIGDVVEFGVGWTNNQGALECDRWWGWIERCNLRALVVIGPYDHPLHAANAARPIVDEVRLSQLDVPDIVDAVTATFGDAHHLG